ncbi:MAG: LysM peptidoglycan-binding domain-containing protein [Anaerolineae bacterium]|nr:LysM peptidoglycan-binding domain-containing protein [Anaerolineae bacterium]
MVNPAYCDIGAGVASAADGTVYYIVHAAYTSAGACGNYQSPTIEAQSNPLQNNPTQAPLGDIDATFEYEVALGDTLWSIAIANDTTVAFIKQINDLDSDEIFIGQVLELPLPPDQIPTLTPALQPSATALARQGTPTNAMVPTQETPSVTVTESAQPTLMSTPEPSAEPPAAQRSNPALIWQVIAGVEFLALVVITFFFWKPWRKPLPENQEHEPHTWQEPD